VVENQKGTAASLVKRLQHRGFQATSVSNIAQTRALISNPREHFDVAILDMLMEDPVDKSTTGIDLGYEIRESQHELPPEFLVYSAHDKPAHYDAALQLGVAAYIKKGTKDEADIFSHISSLALRRGLSPVRHEIGQKIERIAEEDNDVITAVSSLCTQVIKPEIDVSLGVPSIFLLSDDKGTRNLVTDTGMPADFGQAYEQIQNETFDKDSDSDPFVFEGGTLAGELDAQGRDVLRRLEGSTFLRLYAADGLRLSVGILRGERTAALAAEKEPRKLASILNPYLGPPVNRLLKYLSRIEAAIDKAKASAQRTILLDYTSKFCLSVGGTQMSVLDEAVEKGEIDPANECFQKLHKLAVDLHTTGKEFSQLLGTRHRATPPAAPSEKVSARSVVDKAWKMMEVQHLVDRLELAQRGEDFSLAIEEKDLLVAVLRMLQWMAQRITVRPTGPNQKIEVAYEKPAGRLEIHLTDQGRILGAQLRRKLFDPFTLGNPTDVEVSGKETLPGLYLPLYLAKTLVEVKNKGLLQDRTDESKPGHHFVLSFPAEEEKNPDTEVTG
jgi:DNA-binding NarL/FixJ family response regulator